MKVRIDIDTNTFVRFWLVVIGFALAAFAIYSALAALILVGIAFFFALALNGPVTQLAGWLPGKSRLGGTAIAYVIVVAIIGAFLFLVVPPILQQSAHVAETVPGIIDGAKSQWQGVDELVHRYHLESQVENAVNSVKANAVGWAANAGQNVISGVGSLFGIVASTFLVLVLSFLMLLEGPMWLKRIWKVYNDQERMEYHQKLAKRMYDVVTGYVTGQLTVSAIGGVFAGLTVFILHLVFPSIPANLALPSAALAFLLSLIPMFGATIGGVLITLLLAVNNVTAAIIFAVYFIIYQQIENNFISPTIQSKTVELSALMVLIAVTIGLYVFGIAGGIISIPIAGCVKVLLEDYLAQAKQNRKRSEKPLHKLVKKIQNEA